MSKNNRVIRSKMANRYARVVERAHRRNIKKFADDSEGMIAMFDADLADHRKVISLIRKNELGLAFAKAHWMDTAPRDNIPVTVYDWLDQQYVQTS